MHLTLACHRYQHGSEHAYRLADSLYSLTYKQQYSIFDFGARSSPVVLILDRRDDPVTPLLTQWTYQAMVHELVGINDNTVKLTSTKVGASGPCQGPRFGCSRGSSVAGLALLWRSRRAGSWQRHLRAWQQTLPQPPEAWQHRQHWHVCMYMPASAVAHIRQVLHSHLLT
jgi:hypothetical protein